MRMGVHSVNATRATRASLRTQAPCETALYEFFSSPYGRTLSRRPDHRGKRPPQPPRPAAPARSAGPQAGFSKPSGDMVVLYGIHPVREALRQRLREPMSLFATAGTAERLEAEIAQSNVPVRIVEPQDLDRRLGAGAVHQGVLLEARPLPALDLSDIVTKSGIVLLLDQVTDPHNVGAILRSAAAFAVDALVMTERNSPELSGVLAKAASGALEHVVIVHVVNLARALDELGDVGYFRVGLDSDGTADFVESTNTRPLALVLGAEGSGLRRLTRERCDVVARLDMPGTLRSLNVSNAAAVALAMATQAGK